MHQSIQPGKHDEHLPGWIALAFDLVTVPNYIASQSLTLARNPLIMKTLTFRFFPITLIFILALSFASPALAHGDEPRLEISADRMNPGGVIEVRGVDFEFEEVVALALIGSEVEIPLGEITADTEGIFLQIVTLPVDLNEGTYQFRAITDDHEILSPALFVPGPPMMNEEGEGGHRDEEEPLLGPVPTYAPGVVPGGVAQTTTPAAPTTTVSVSSQSPNPIILSALLIVGVLVLFGLRVMRKR